MSWALRTLFAPLLFWNGNYVFTLSSVLTTAPLLPYVSGATKLLDDATTDLNQLYWMFIAVSVAVLLTWYKVTKKQTNTSSPAMHTIAHKNGRFVKELHAKCKKVNLIMWLFRNIENIQIFKKIVNFGEFWRILKNIGECREYSRGFCEYLWIFWVPKLVCISFQCINQMYALKFNCKAFCGVINWIEMKIIWKTLKVLTL